MISTSAVQQPLLCAPSVSLERNMFTSPAIESVWGQCVYVCVCVCVCMGGGGGHKYLILTISLYHKLLDLR